MAGEGGGGGRDPDLRGGGGLLPSGGKLGGGAQLSLPTAGQGASRTTGSNPHPKAHRGQGRRLQGGPQVPPTTISGRDRVQREQMCSQPVKETLCVKNPGTHHRRGAANLDQKHRPPYRN